MNKKENKEIKMKNVKRKEINILMIMPKYSLNTQRNYNYSFPLGLGYVTSSLKNAGFNVDCLNLNHTDKPIKEFIFDKLKNKKYQFVCTGHYIYGYNMVEKIVNIVKEFDKNINFILGGTMITSEPKFIMENLNIDYGVIGEGEITIIELLDTIISKQDISKVDGICYRKDNEIKFTSKRKDNTNLDISPYPEMDDFGFKEQLENQNGSFFYSILDNPRCYTIIGSRGCPHKCTFCYHICNFRVRSVKSVIDELKYAINKYQINSFYLVDDLFSYNKERLLEFCEELQKLKVKLTWMCALSVNVVDNEELLKILKNAGCFLVLYGFESYSKTVLKSMKKSITPEQIKRAFLLTRKVGLGIEGFFIFGDVKETKESAAKTLSFWKKYSDGQIQLIFIMPYPDSEIWQYCINNKIIKNKLDYIKHDLPHQNWLNMTEKMSDKEIKHLEKEIIKLTYKYMKYVIPKDIRKENGRYNFKIICPYCNKEVNYRNLVLNNSLFFHLLVCCRKCYMRFYLSSFLFKVYYKYYYELSFIRRVYLRLKNNYWKNE